MRRHIERLVIGKVLRRLCAEHHPLGRVARVGSEGPGLPAVSVRLKRVGERIRGKVLVDGGDDWLRRPGSCEQAHHQRGDFFVAWIRFEYSLVPSSSGSRISGLSGDIAQVSQRDQVFRVERERSLEYVA